MDLPAAEPLDQRFVEAARVGEERETSPRQNAARVVEDREQVAPQQRLAAGEEDVIDAVRRALVQDRLPLVGVKLGFRERGVFVPYAVAIRTAEVALRRQLTIIPLTARSDSCSQAALDFGGSFFSGGTPGTGNGVSISPSVTNTSVFSFVAFS